MISLKSAVIVEGKYDKINLENYIDALIITTGGFSLFKDKEKLNLIRLVAEKNGIIVLTDSDSAGNLIRAHLKGVIPNGKITNVYVPQICGKERRKAKMSKEGFLGVEGLSGETLLEAFEKSDVFYEKTAKKGKKITKTDMYFWGLSGREQSKLNRYEFLAFMNLPRNLTANALMDYLNSAYTFEEISEQVMKWQESRDKK